MFINDARARGRLPYGTSIDDAAQIVAEMMAPRGIYAETTYPPTRLDERSACHRTGRRPYVSEHGGSWVIA